MYMESRFDSSLDLPDAMDLFFEDGLSSSLFKEKHDIFKVRFFVSLISL